MFMNRLAIFVDAGYFFAAGAQAAFSISVPRRSLSIKAVDELVVAITEKACQQAGNSNLLRVYWYDALSGPRPSLDQHTLAMQAGLKLRLGALNSAGEQKGVDSLIITDLIELARNQAIADAVLVSGDEDLRVAVEVAQTFGVRVHILAAGDASRNVSLALQMAADSMESLDAAWFKKYLESTSTQPQVREITAPAGQVLALEDAAKQVAQTTVQALDSEQLKQLSKHFETNSTVPPEFDRKFVASVAARCGGAKLSGDQLRTIRGIFVTAVRTPAK
jgi:uncharacterized LabA/DUF88 family protein